MNRTRRERVVLRAYADGFASYPDFAGIFLFDGPSPVAQWSPYYSSVTSIAFTSASTLYGYDGQDTSYELYELTVGASALTLVTSTGELIREFFTSVVGQGGWSFASNGFTIDGATMVPVGTYDAQGSVWPAPDGMNVWFLEAADVATPELIDFDRTSFTARRLFELSPSVVDPDVGSLVGFSPTGLAFRTSSAVCVVTVPAR